MHRGGDERSRAGRPIAPIDRSVPLSWLASGIRTTTAAGTADGFMKHDNPDLGPDRATVRATPLYDVGVNGPRSCSPSWGTASNSQVRATTSDDSEAAASTLAAVASRTPRPASSGSPPRRRTSSMAMPSPPMRWWRPTVSRASPYKVLKAATPSGPSTTWKSHRNPYAGRGATNPGTTTTTPRSPVGARHGSGAAGREHFGLQVSDPMALKIRRGVAGRGCRPGDNGRHGYTRRGAASPPGRIGDHVPPDFPREKGEAMTALALSCRFAMGQRSGGPPDHGRKAADLADSASPPEASTPPTESTTTTGSTPPTPSTRMGGRLLASGGQQHLKDVLVDRPRGRSGNFLRLLRPSPGVVGTRTAGGSTALRSQAS